jgi:hypothetical protein
MYINVTQKAYKMFRNYPAVADPDQAKADAQANPLYSWHASYFTINHRRTLGFINDASGLFLVISNVTASQYSQLDELFRKQLTKIFRKMGMNHQQIATYFHQGGQWQINKTIDRSIVGKLSENMRNAKAIVSDSVPQMVRALLNAPDFEYLKGAFANPPAQRRAKSTATPKTTSKLKLQNAIQQLRYISDHREELLASRQVDGQVEKVQQQNNTLIAAFIDANRDKLSAKTLRRHQSCLDFFLNAYLGETLATIFSAEALDLEEPQYHGCSFSEMSQTKTALKKFYKYLDDQQLISTDEWSEIKEVLNEQLKDGDPTIDMGSLRNMFSYVNNDHGKMSRDTENLLKTYGTACANLYGLISCDQLYRIMAQQNPAADLDPDQLIDWFEGHQDKRRDGFVVNNVMGVPSIVHPAVYSQKTQEDLLSYQLGMTYYLPDKDELLKYQNAEYFADTRRLKNYQIALHKYARVPQDKLGQWADAAWQRQNKFFLKKQTDFLHDLNKKMAAEGYICQNQVGLQKWLASLIDLLNNNRLWINRGHTPNEAHQLGSVIVTLRKTKRLTSKMIKNIKAARLDPIDIEISLGYLDNLTEKEKERINDQLIDLPILSLAD